MVGVKGPMVVERVGGGAFDGPNFASRAEAVVGVVNGGAQRGVGEGRAADASLVLDVLEVSTDQPEQ